MLIVGVVWFAAADVCRVLGLGNPAEAVRSLDDDEKDISNADTLGGPQRAVVISESGLYALILRSRKPAALKFRKWVTGEVLPAARSGGPQMGETDPAATPGAENGFCAPTGFLGDFW